VIKKAKSNPTLKYDAAIRLALMLKDDDIFAAITLGRKMFYSTLKEKGWQWNISKLDFVQGSPVVTKFSNENGETTGAFTIRISGHPDTAHPLLDRVFTSLRRAGATSLTVSNDIKAKNGSTVLVFLRGKYLEGEENQK
jgi:hypothetical protein